MRKKAQEYTSLFSPSLASKTLYDLFVAIRADAGLAPMEKTQLISQIKGMTGGVPESTPLSALMHRGLGGVFGYLISKYFKMGAVGQVFSAIAGAGIGAKLNNQLNQPRQYLPGMRII